MQPSTGIGITTHHRLQVVNTLNSILNQYYTTQPGYLLKRAKHYESTCFKRARSKHDYYTYVNEGIYKIAVTYKRQYGKPGARPSSQPSGHVSGTPVTPAISPPTSIPLPRPADCISNVHEFLISLGLTPVTDCPQHIPMSQPNNSLPNQSPPLQGVSTSFPQSTPLQHHAPSNIPVVSTATSTISQGTNLPIAPPQVQTPQKMPTDQSQKTPKTTRAKSSTERSRIQRARKRNSVNAGLQTLPQKAPSNRSIAPKLDAVNMDNASTQPQSIGQLPASSHAAQMQLGALQSQVPVSAHVNTPLANTQSAAPLQTGSVDFSAQDRVMIADGIYVSIAQVYITAASLGHRLTADNIRSMSSEQVVNLFLHARQVTITNAPNCSAQLNAGPQLDPLGLAIPPSNLTGTVPVSHAGALAPDHSAQLAGQQIEQDPLHQANASRIPQHPAQAFSNTAQGTSTANQNTTQQHVETQSAPFYGMPQQDFPNVQVSNPAQSMAAQASQSQAEEIQPNYTGIQHIQSSAAFQEHLGNRTSEQRGPLATATINQVQSGTAIRPPSNLTQQSGIDVAPSRSYSPSPFQLVLIRLQRFQQKYRVYLKLVEDNLALLTAQDIQGLERERYYRYMRYVVKLLTCPMSTANRISMAIIDKVESFLREYLVRYQGIALKKRANPVNEVSGSSPGGGIAPHYASNVPVQVPSGPTPSLIPQASQMGFLDLRLVQQNDASVPEMNNLMQSNIAAGAPTSPPQNASFAYQPGVQTSRNATLRAIEAQREAVAAAGLRQARAEANKRILSDQLSGENVSVPTPNPNLPLNAQAAPGITPVASAAENRTPIDIHAQLAQRVSRVNHYVSTAVHWTNILEKNMENESLLRVQEERIAEACYAIDSGNRIQVQEKESGVEAEPEPSLMDTVKKECEDAREKHPKLIIEIQEEWKRPVVSCLLAFKSIRMPKMIIHVPGTYRKERYVSFGFESPPLGWIGIVGDVKKKFYSIRQGEEGVSELLGTWIEAAEEFLKEE